MHFARKNAGRSQEPHASVLWSFRSDGWTDTRRCAMVFITINFIYASKHFIYSTPKLKYFIES